MTAPQTSARTTRQTPIARQRIAWNLRQADVADEVGITRPQLANIERGLSPSIEVALRLARYYGTTVDALFGHLIADEGWDSDADNRD